MRRTVNAKDQISNAKTRKLPSWTRPIITGLMLSVTMTSTLTYRTLAQRHGWTGVPLHSWTNAVASLLPYSFPIATAVHPVVRRVVNRIVSSPTPTPQVPIRALHNDAR